MAKMIQSKTRAARKCRARQWCSSSDDNESQFKVMVIHDDMRSGVGAQNALDAVARQIGQGALDIRFWKHDILTHGNLWQQASAEAEEANLIVFAMSTPAILPAYDPHCRRHLGREAPRRDRGGRRDPGHRRYAAA